MSTPSNADQHGQKTRSLTLVLLLIWILVTFVLNWFAREGFPTGEIGHLLHLMHEIDHNGLSALLSPLRQTRHH